MNHLREEIFNKELATKRDIQKIRKDLELSESRLTLKIEKEIAQLQQSIAQLGYDSLKFVLRTGIGVVVVLGGMLARGFHWF